MTIVLKRVVGRNNQLWGDMKKDISISLGQVREFVTQVTQTKTSARGFKLTCEQIESFMPGAMTSLEFVRHKVFDEDGVEDTAFHLEYSEEIDAANGSYLSKLCRATKNLQRYFEHFSKLAREETVARAALSIKKYRKDLLRVIDKAKSYNIKIVEEIKKYLNSEVFSALLLAPDSCIAISEGDLKGTPAEKRKFIAELKARIAEAEDEGRDNAAAGAQPIREENFIADDASDIDADRAPSRPIADDDEEDGGDDEKKQEPDALEESFDSEDLDDEEDEDIDIKKETKKRKHAKDDDDDEDGDGDDDDDDEDEDDKKSSSEGGALTDAALEQENATLLESVEKNAIVKGGRLLRDNGRLQAYAQIVKHNKDLRVNEYRESKPKKHSAGKTDGEGDYDSEISDSDEDGGGGGTKNQVEAYMKQIEKERKKSASSNNGAAAKQTKKLKKTPSTNGIGVKQEHRNGEHSQTPPTVKIKQEPGVASTSSTTTAAINKYPIVKIKQEPIVSDD